MIYNVKNEGIMKNFLKKPVSKAFIGAVLTIAIGVITSLLGNWDTTQKFFVIKVLTFIVLALLYIITTIIYTVIDLNQRQSYEILKHQVDTFEDLVISIISICQNTSSDVNKCIHVVNEKHIIDPNIWDYEKACRIVSEQVYNNICRLSDSKKYGVAYIKLIEDERSENEVEMIAYANQNHHQPTIFKLKRNFKNIDKKNSYHDLCLFAERKADSDIRFGIDEVNEVFAYDSKEKAAKNHNKYHLYVGIPVFCDDDKMVGLLEIVGLDDTKFRCKSKDEVEEIVNKFLVPYANVFLLLQKLEKALLAGTKAKP